MLTINKWMSNFKRNIPFNWNYLFHRSRPSSMLVKGWILNMAYCLFAHRAIVDF